MHKYRFPIGDWSGDGHDKCDWFLVMGEKPVEEVREAHFKAEEFLGFDIGSICSNYKEFKLPKDKEKRFSELGIELPEMDKYDPDDEESEFIPCPEKLVQLWLNILNKVDSSLKLKIIPEEQGIPSINFYGFDSKKRHLSVPGYGIFLF